MVRGNARPWAESWQPALRERRASEVPLSSCPRALFGGSHQPVQYAVITWPARPSASLPSLPHGSRGEKDMTQRRLRASGSCC